MCQFADIQILRYRLPGFESLSLRQKLYIYHLAKATEAGRDITFDQNCRHNLAIRQLLEDIYTNYKGDREDPEFQAFATYLKRVWFSNGIHHHYGMEKFTPGFSREWFEKVQSAECRVQSASAQPNSTFNFQLSTFLLDVIFNPDILPKRVNKAEGQDLIKTSACNFYSGVTQEEVEDFYNKKKRDYKGDEMPSFGLNSTLVKVQSASAQPDSALCTLHSALKENSALCTLHSALIEQTWCINGGKYAKELSAICSHLADAKEYAENDKQKRLIDLLISYYHTGDLRTFDEYSKLWVTEKEGEIDFINGFIEVYGDPLGYKATWEGLVEYVDHKATEKTKLIADNAQWFEDNSPVDDRFKKKRVKGVSARVICAAMLGGGEYPATAIGINLPNADWIREQYGSKSVTISNIIAAYNEAAKGSPMKREFTRDERMIALIDKYADQCDSLHTDLHECLGHGSGQLLPNVSTDALKNYFSTIEEARADLFGLYYCADEKMLELGLLPDEEAYKSMYYTYMLNGLLTQLVRIKLGDCIEEDHMRNRALIARWALDMAPEAVQLYKEEGKTFLRINDFARLRSVFARQLAEIQRIKSEGDYPAAKHLIETYAVSIDQELHKEILDRYEKLHIAPYKGFINPTFTLQKDEDGNITDVIPGYDETYEEQMLRLSLVQSAECRVQSASAQPNSASKREQSSLLELPSESRVGEANSELCTLHSALQKILRSFPLYMDGVAAQSMREKGVEYKINWGIKLGDLKRIASEHDKDYSLAADLWKRNTRECKILALMLMPPEEFAEDLAQLWLEQTPTIEIAELLAYFLIQHTDYAATLAFQWIASKSKISQACGYNTLASLFAQGRQPSVRDMHELIDQALAARTQQALKCLNKLADLSDEHEQIVMQAIKKI